jgi:RHS repeat-associated protein
MRNNLGIAAGLAALAGALPAGLLCLVGVLAVAIPVSPAQAANGQCRWEGGAGSPTAAYCAAEDCVGRGGLAQCSAGVGAVLGGYTEEQSGPNKWIYSADNGYNNQPINAAWCNAAGGYWDGATNPQCLNLPAGVIGGGGRLTNDEGLSISISNAFVDNYLQGCGGKILTGDTGWQLNIESLGVGTVYSRVRNFVGATCSSVEISMAKMRSAKCPAGYASRTAVTGQECYKLGECNTGTCAGNPVSVVSGTKYHRERDYAPGAQTGLEFSRYYNSAGYYWPEYLAALDPTGDLKNSDYWRHTYERRFIPITGNSEVIAVLQRPDGSIQVFDSAGNEKTNRAGTYGTGGRLQAVAGGWDLTLATKDVEHYDSAQRLTSITTRAGLVTTLAYGDGHLQTVTGPFGHALTFDYDGGALVSVTLPGNTSINFGYDGFGRMASVTHADNATKTYLYGNTVNRWLLTGIQDENESPFATYNYDAAGRVVSEQHAGGVNSYTFNYGALGQPTTVTDPLGTATQYGLASVGGFYRIASHSQACLECGAYASTTYDTNGNVATRTDFNGHQTIYTFDTARNLETSRTEASGTPRARTITTQWHATFRLPVEINEPGRRTNLAYDGAGNLLTQTVTDAATTVSRTWTFAYTALGQVLSIDGPRSDVSDITTFTYYACASGGACGQLQTVTDAAGNLTTFGSYNAHGQPLSVTDPNGTLIALTYDNRQRLTSRSVAGETTALEYWPTGLLKKVTQPDGSFASYGYDSAHRLTSVTDTEGNSIVYTLNSAGQRLTEEVRDSLSVLKFRRTHTYNALGRETEELGTASQTTSFVYDANGNVTEIEDPRGRITTQAYDELHRLANLTDAELKSTQFSYDGADNLLSVLDPRSLLTSYVYNGFGETVALTSPDTGASSSPRDAAGNLDLATDARNKTGNLSHDALNRVTSVVYPDETLAFTYDQGNGKGQLTAMTDGAGTTSWTYDAAGRVTERSRATGAVTLEVGYGYDIFGRLATLTTPSGQVLGYEYQNGRLSGLTVNGAWLLSQVAYQPFGPTKSWTWGNGTTTTRTYDTDGQLTQISSAGTSSYTFFLDGLIASRTDDFVASIPSTAGTTNFAISSTSNRVESASGLLTRSYGYDAAGHTTSDGSGSFTYDDAGRLKTATSAGLTTTYGYNGLGERVKKTSSSSTRYFAYDEAGHLIGEYDTAGALLQETVWFGDIPVATLRPAGGGGVEIYYIHSDHLNTPRRITRPADNTILWRWDSEPYGSTPANEDPDGDTVVFAYHLRFPGQYFDAETGLHYNYFRDYDAVTGRYIQSDPIGLAGGINTYGYGYDNPLRYIDPRGLDIAVIENGPTDTNPIGHTAIAVTGAGLYSFGNEWDLGGSLIDYLRREAPRRDTKIYIIKTTPAQDRLALEYLRQFKTWKLPGDFWSVYFFDNCSTRSNRALDAAGVLGFPMDLMSQPQPYNVPGSSSLRSGGKDTAQYFIPRNATSFPLELSLFEPN